jgi:hypothetical protein
MPILLKTTRRISDYLGDNFDRSSWTAPFTSDQQKAQQRAAKQCIGDEWQPVPFVASGLPTRGVKRKSRLLSSPYRTAPAELTRVGKVVRPSDILPDVRGTAC